MKTPGVMWLVSGLLLPGLIGMGFAWGPGVLWNVLWLAALCALTELTLSTWRGRIDLQAASGPWYASLVDGTWLLTALIMAACLPPGMPVGALVVAATGAIGLAKHLYGGLGRNLFNPAMVGYALVLVSYPASLNTWPGVDGFSGATLLTEFRYRPGTTETEFLQSYNRPDAWVPWLFAAAGLVLAGLRVIHLRLPAAMLLGLAVASFIGTDQGSSEGTGSAWLHITSGGALMAAFFVLTDPVTHPRDARHQWIFGFTVGVFVYLIRSFGMYPDGIAFAVLLGNCMVPLLDRMADRPVPGRVTPTPVPERSD